MEQEDYKNTILKNIKSFIDINQSFYFEDLDVDQETQETLVTTQEAASLAVIYVLYGVHKQFVAEQIENGLIAFKAVKHSLPGKILSEILKLLQNANNNSEECAQLYELYTELSLIPYSEFEKHYFDTLVWVNDNAAAFRGPIGNFSETSLSSLIAHYIRINDCKSVFDPFCGTASIVHYLNGISFTGQDIDKSTSLIAQVNMETHYGQHRIICTDSIHNWNTAEFDAIVSCPPFVLDESKYNGLKTYEDFFIKKAFEENHAKIVISLEYSGFLRSTDSWHIREYLITNNLLDTIILLPKGLLYGMGDACVLIICKANRKKEEAVKFIDAGDFYNDENGTIRSRVFDLERYTKAIEKQENTLTKVVTRELLEKLKGNIMAAYFFQKQSIPTKEQQVVTWGDLISIAPSDPDFDSFDKYRKSYPVYTYENLKADFYDILRTQNRSLIPDNGHYSVQNLYHPQSNTSYLLCTMFNNDEFCMGLYDGTEDFVSETGTCVMIINKNLVYPEYLVHLILNQRAFKEKFIKINECLELPIAIDSLDKQKKLMKGIIQQYEYQEESDRQAIAKRMGARENISDLVHILGTPKVKIKNILKILKKTNPENSDYKDLTQQLEDNIGYLFRIIDNYKANISSETINPKPENIADYIKQYVEGWNNYGKGLFTLITNLNNISTDLEVDVDTDKLTVMFDAILDNAGRHGFHKNSKYTPNNLVEIALSLVSYNEKPYLLIAVSNNGDVLDPDFTIQDYSTKGRYSETSGRSGMGGNHVYEIAKGHNGYLYLDSNKSWNMVVEILLPVKNIDPSKLTRYEHECI